MTLRLPREDEEVEFLRAHRATSPSHPSFLQYYTEGMRFRLYLDRLAAQSRGENLITERPVASTFLFAFVDDRIVGRVSIRHALGEWHAKYGGHIGYVVVPEFRLRGHATEILRQALPIARAKTGETRILITCDDDNVGSIRTIERNGGVFEGIVGGPGLDKPKRRYWIDAERISP